MSDKTKPQRTSLDAFNVLYDLSGGAAHNAVRRDVAWPWFDCGWAARDQEHDALIAERDSYMDRAGHAESDAEALRDWLDELEAAARLLADAPHVLQVRDDGWGLQHPLRCRPALTECQVHRVTSVVCKDGPPAPVGEYVLSDEGEIQGEYDGADLAAPLLAILAREVDA